MDYGVEWTRLVYPKEMGSAKFLPPPDHNFVRVYHLTSAEHGISSIRFLRGQSESPSLTLLSR